MDASRLRQKIVISINDLSRLKDSLATRKPMSRGTVYELRRKCGKENCRCQEGDLHKQICLSWGEGGKGRLRPLRGPEIEKYKKLTGYHNKFRKSRAKFRKLSKEVVELSNQLEVLMLKEGERWAKSETTKKGKLKKT